MSVLIKGMEMPKDCGECQFCHTENFIAYCCPTGRDDIFYDAIPEWCPLEEPKTGEWVLEEQKSQNHIENIYICSSCKNFEAWGKTELYNFCPNCGAEMTGVKDD